MKLLSMAVLLFSTVQAFTYERLNRNDSLLVIVDMQVGLFSMVRDYEPEYFFRNMLAHARLAKAFELPVVMSTSAEQGLNGPLPRELTDMFPNAPLVRRPGEINAWDNPQFRAAIESANKTQIIVAGILTDVCIAFVAQSLREAGYSVWANLEASGTSNDVVRDAANAQMRDAGVHVVSWFSMAGELMRDWRTPPTGESFLNLIHDFLPTGSMVLRSHKYAILNGVIQPGEESDMF